MYIYLFSYSDLPEFLPATVKDYPNSTMASRVQFQWRMLLNLYKTLQILGNHPPRSARASFPSVSAGTSRGAKGQVQAAGVMLMPPPTPRITGGRHSLHPRRHPFPFGPPSGSPSRCSRFAWRMWRSPRPRCRRGRSAGGACGSDMRRLRPSTITSTHWCPFLL